MSQHLQHRNEDNESLKALREKIVSKREERRLEMSTLGAYNEEGSAGGHTRSQQPRPSSPLHHNIATFPLVPSPVPSPLPSSSHSPSPSYKSSLPSPNVDRYSFFDPNTSTPVLPSPTRTRTVSQSHANINNIPISLRRKSNSFSQRTLKGKERSDSLLVSERSFYRRDDNASNILSNNIDSRIRSIPNVPDLSRRSVSDSLVGSTSKLKHNTIAQSPKMTSNVQQTPSSDALNVDKPRNSSIDSVISTISTTSDKAQKPSSETTNEDITKLIQAAGSSDAVIRYLLKEKNSFTSQNTQLWRLVDKQRAMILGLNKDLERSLKEKERYRRKLKDTLASTSLNLAPLPSHSDRGKKSPDPTSELPTNHTKTIISPELHGAVLHIHDELPPSPIDATLAAYPLTPPASDAGRRPNVNDNTNELPCPTILEEHEQLRDPIQSALASLGDFHGEESESSDVVRATNLASPEPPHMELPADPPHVRRTTQVARKGPPAALRLQRQNSDNMSASAMDLTENDDDEDDDDDESTLDSLLEVSELSGPSPMLAVPELQEYARSSGLPMSPRPQDQTFTVRGSSLASPALSQRGFSSSIPLSPRPPRTPIMLPPNISATMSSPPTPKDDMRSYVSDDRVVDKVVSSTDRTSGPEDIYRGLMSQEYPDLLLPPTALSLIQARVVSSRLQPSRASLMTPMRLDEDPVFTLAVVARSDGHELWRIEKDSASLANLDQVLKQSARFTAKTPERSLFSGHAPAKIDARRQALDSYLKDLIETDFEVPLALELCRYLASNVLKPNVDMVSTGKAGDDTASLGPGGRPTRNGYLTKRGKNFGGWKARFFVLDGPLLKYYEAPGGAHLGSIKLPKAEIGKQSQQQTTGLDTEDMDHQYRHAFLIMEPKKKDSSTKVRHVLCAESDEERDLWVTTLLTYVNYVSADEVGDTPSTTQSKEQSRKASGQTGNKKKVYGQGKVLSVPYSEEERALKSVGYHDTTQGKIPARGLNTNASALPQPPKLEKTLPASSKPISAPKNATMISDGGAWGNKPSATAVLPEAGKQRKRSFFGFGPKSRTAPETDVGSTSNLMQMSYDQHGPIRPSFGAPLSEAVRYCHPANVDVELPAVVYRCIEYLDAKNAAGEEGIFRLSGSNVVIRGLRDRFNTEGDINLITDEQYYDIHAVASLLKLYLRELPTTILTRELHLDFLAVTELDDIQDKVKVLNRLVGTLPPCNASLLRCLASFLINIINHSEVNKMTVRNVGIVFSPTLNIPAPVFALFLQQYEGVFDEEPQVGRNQSSPFGSGAA